MKKTTRNDILKIIAMVTMLIDHLGVLYFPEYRILRTIGRIAFPIFAYQLALGYTYTSNRLLYTKRLIIFGLIAQIPYMFLSYDLEFNYLHFNVILLFAYAIGMLFVFDKLKASNQLYKTVLLSFGLLSIIFLPFIIEIFEHDFFLSYGTYGLLLILLFYVFKNKPYSIVVGFILITLFTTYLTGAYYLQYFSTNNITFIEAFFSYDTVSNNIINYKNGLITLDGYFFQARSIIAIYLIIALQNKSFNIHLNKYIGYWFYPVHLIILIGFRFILDTF